MIREAIEAFASRSPSRFAILVFAAIIALFTILLSLPVASADGQATNFADAFFTATSMVCVAGLTTVDMATLRPRAEPMGSLNIQPSAGVTMAMATDS